MATLEDKILGEKLHYYCSSSSEDEGNDSADSDDEGKSGKIDEASASNATLDNREYNKWDGSSSNTGPKGVINDWQRFRQMETEKRAEQEKERVALMKKLTLTCKSALDEEKDRLEATDPDLAELLDDQFLLDYQKQRMQEMVRQAERLKFGQVYDLKSADEFLKAIDDEHHSVTIVVHIYEDNIEGCETTNGCLFTLASEYPSVKFCKIRSSVAGLSNHFKKEGVPALLVYKKGQVVGNFVRVTDNLGTDFYASDLENFLIENGMFNNKNCIPPIIRGNVDSDSD